MSFVFHESDTNVADVLDIVDAAVMAAFMRDIQAFKHSHHAHWFIKFR